MYYIIKESTDSQTVGTDFPQVYKYVKEYKPNAPRALYALYKFRTSFPDYIPELGGFKLSGYAKLTDFLSTPFMATLVSPKAKEVLQRYHLCPHRWYPCTIHSRKKVYDYFWLHIISDNSDFVDYKKSTFVEYDFSRKGKTVHITSKKELLEKKQLLKEANEGKNITIWADKIVMNYEFDKELDLFEITRIDGSTYVSERLKNAILEHELTGYEFIPAVNFSISAEADL